MRGRFKQELRTCYTNGRPNLYKVVGATDVHKQPAVMGTGRKPIRPALLSEDEFKQRADDI